VKAYRGKTLVTTVVAPAGATRISVPGLRNGLSYTFTVAATNAVGAGPASERTLPVTPATRPGAPRIVAVKAGVREATLRWAAPADNGGAEVFRYTLRTWQGKQLVRSEVLSSHVTSTTIRALSAEAKYRFTVTATNQMGGGPASGASAWVVPRRR
jgi:hypothetical protein